YPTRSSSDLGSGRDADSVLRQSALCVKRHVALYQSKQGVILANTDVGAGVELSATLANNDRACADQFTTESLHTQHFWLGITSVARRAAAFFLCHDLAPSELSSNRHDLQFGELLTMALGFSVVLATAQLEDTHFVVLAVGNNCCLHSCAG